MAKGNFLGGLFDFNRDGKMDLSEQYLAYKIFEECAKEEPKAGLSFSDDSWREDCEDGSEYGLDPEDYDSEEEYEEALEEAQEKENF